MAYIIWLDDMRLPITPGKIETKIKNNNKTLNLINEGEITIIKPPGLTEYDFEFMLPQSTYYPFSLDEPNKLIDASRSLLGITKTTPDAKKYLDKLEQLKTSKKPFNFKVLRNLPSGGKLFDTCQKVTLEEYDILEDSKNGFDLMVTIKLKEYRDYTVKELEEIKTISKVSTKNKTKAVNTKAKRNTDSKKTPTSYTVKQGDSLGLLAKRFLGTESKWQEIYQLNKKVIEDTAKKNGKKSSSSGRFIWPGAVLKIPKGK